MAFEAQVGGDKLAKEVRIHLIDSRPVGTEVAPLQIGDTIKATFHNARSYGIFHVVAVASATDVHIADEKGTRWHMTRLRFGEHPSSIQTHGGLPSEDWVIR